MKSGSIPRGLPTRSARTPCDALLNHAIGEVDISPELLGDPSSIGAHSLHQPTDPHRCTSGFMSGNFCTPSS
jgi:hypothetical protein